MTEQLQKLTPEDGQSLDIESQNIEQLKQLFPDVFREGKVDFEALKAVLGEHVEDKEERYNFTWHGKNKARQIAQTPSTGTLRPCKEESVNWDTTQNLFIEGDNLEVLKLLQKSYHQKVKMIYIDPPYNTGKDFVYKDNFHNNLDNYLELTNQIDGNGIPVSANSESVGRYHTNWLNMIYPRLKLMRNLLATDGLIFISIDDYEMNNLKRVCDEIFGEENSLEPIVWKKRYQGAKEKHLVGVHEYILVYAKNKRLISDIYVPATQEYIDRYYTNKDENYELRGGYRTQPLEAGRSMDERANLVFEVETENGLKVLPKRQWVWSKERVEDAMKHGEIGFTESKSGEVTPYIKQYLKDRNGVIRKTKKQTLIDNVFTQNGTKEVQDIFGESNVFNFPKPSDLIKQLLEIANVESDDIVLDCFAGSSSTVHAIEKYSQENSCLVNFFMIQIPEELPTNSKGLKMGFKNIAELSRERIRRTQAIFKQGKGFKTFKLDSSNINQWEPSFDNLSDILENSVDSIKSDRLPEDVLYEILLKYGLDLTYPITEHSLAGKTVYDVAFGSLIVCLDDDISQAVVEEIGKLKQELDSESTRVVFKDSGFADDAVKVNAVQLLKQYGVDDVKSI